ncbi:MAG: S-layer homology domain-containing protein [Clostridia bacterium]|nr:S-layer homology domain-containing protein [Clostridia bacterium]
MKTKITAIFIIIMLLLQTVSFAAFTDVDKTSDVGSAITQLVNLGVLSGYPDGSFVPDGLLTRAQFAKIAVCMLGAEKEALSLSGNNVFSDVGANHWASGYINCIAQKGIINGYPDGSFGAEDTITYAQALTILVRLLGYDGKDVNYNWPDGYIKKAQSLGITKGMIFDTYENVTRGNAAYIIYNTLFADKKEGSSINLLSSSSVEDVVIYADSTISASVPNGSVLTTAGTYKLSANSTISEADFWKSGTLYLDSDKKAISFVPENETSRAVTIISSTVNADKVEITFTEDGIIKEEKFSATAPVFYEGAASVFASVSPSVETGSEALLFYDENGNFARAYVKKSSLIGPVTVTSGASQVYSSFNIKGNDIKIIRDGQNAILSDVEVYDVVYYMENTNTIYAYSDKASGIYEEAYPYKSEVTSVKVGGREYALSTQTAMRKMNTSEGAFEIGERVTLLFGRNKEVVDVVSLSAGEVSDLVVLTRSYKQISTDRENAGESISYIDVVLTDGTNTTYRADSDYSDYIGEVMRLGFDGNIATLEYVTPNVIHGEFDKNVPSLDGHWLSKDCPIFELTRISESVAEVKKIDVRDIETTTLNSDQVIHAYTSGTMQDIYFLFVKDVTKKESTFGVVTKVSGRNHTILVEDETININTALLMSVSSAVEIKTTENGMQADPLIKIATGYNIEGYEDGRIRIDGRNYNISDYVKVYGASSEKGHESMSMSQILNNKNITKIDLFSDKILSAGGVVRAIVVSLK